MKFTKEIVEKVFENLGNTPESIHEFNNRVEFTTALDYKQTFDADDIKFFDSINVASWEIYKHWIEFGVDVKDEKELEDVARKVIDKYFD